MDDAVRLGFAGGLLALPNNVTSVLGTRCTGSSKRIAWNCLVRIPRDHLSSEAYKASHLIQVVQHINSNKRVIIIVLRKAV
jgi:hypothetical protein